MATRVIIRGRGLEIAGLDIYETPVSFELLRAVFACPMRVTHERNPDTWHVDLHAALPMAEIEHPHFRECMHGRRADEPCVECDR